MSLIEELTIRRSDGTDIVIRKGDRVTWKNPLGIGGTEVSGKFVDAERDDVPGCRWISVACIDAEPSESIRALAGESAGFRASMPQCLLDGGQFVVVGEAFERAVYDGLLTLTPKTPEPNEEPKSC